MQDNSQVTIAIIGTGLIGPRHAKSVDACSDARLLCLVDPRPEAEPIAKAFAVPLFKDVRDMLKQECRPDAAIVCTPNNLHVSISLELLQSEIHVLVEKPISIDVSTAQKLVNAAATTDKHLLVGHHRRFNPCVVATKQALQSGAIGTPVAISGLWATYKPTSYFTCPTEWRAQPGTGGPILINLIHEVDVLQYLLGAIVRVHAEQTISQRHHDVEEGVAILFKFASGVVGTFILSDAVPSTHNFESGTGENPTIPKSGTDFYRIMGTGGTLSVGDMLLENFSEDTEMSWTNALQETKIAVGDEVPFDEQVLNFVHVIKGTEQPRCTGEDGLRALRVCQAVREAMETEKAVNIDV